MAEIAPQALANELRRIDPAEVLVSEDSHLEGYFTTRLPPWQFDVDNGRKKLKQLGAATLAGFGCEDLTLAIGACGALLEYAGKTQGRHSRTSPRSPRSAPAECVRLDAATRATSNSPRPCAASRRRHSFRSSTNAPPAWAAGSCATGCTTRYGTAQPWWPGTRPSLA